jgi:O-antigen/teichoic acid export membrane protein
MSTNTNELIRGGRLAKNVIWSLLSVAIPFLVAIITIPILIESIGKDRFGLLAISWMFVGYFSLFDFGLGRALTVLVAKYLGEEKSDQIPGLAWTAMIMMAVLGVTGLGIVYSLTPWLVGSVLNVPVELQPETQKAFYLLSLSIPFVIITVGLRGVIAAYQRFDLLTAIRVPMGIFTFVGPVAVLPFSLSLYPIVAVLVFGRFIAMLAHVFVLFRTVPSIRQYCTLDTKQLGPLFGYSGWMTVSNMVVPLMVSMDRFVIGAVLSMTAVAYYTTPSEILFRLLVIPSAFVAVLLPAQSTTLAIEKGEERKYSAKLFNKGLSYIFITLFPLLLVISVFSYDGLKLWVDDEFATNGYSVMQLMTAGVLLYGLSLVPFSLVQSAGHADWSAKLHLMELPIYYALLWWVLPEYGILGAAAVWTLRAWVDAIALYIMSLILVPECRVSITRLVFFMIATFMLFVIAAMFDNLQEKAIFVAVILGCFTYVVWYHVLEQKEKQWLLKELGLGLDR